MCPNRYCCMPGSAVTLGPPIEGARVNCPTCGESSQVLRLEEFWRSLSQDAELKRDLAQPPEYPARWLIPLGLVVLAVVVLTSGSVGAGLLLLLAGLAASGTWDAVADRDSPRTTSAADLNLALNDMDAQAANITAVDRG